MMNNHRQIHHMHQPMCNVTGTLAMIVMMIIRRHQNHTGNNGNNVADDVYGQDNDEFHHDPDVHPPLHHLHPLALPRHPPQRAQAEGQNGEGQLCQVQFR